MAGGLLRLIRKPLGVRNGAKESHNWGWGVGDDDMDNLMTEYGFAKER
jgi:hypothetical protein